MLQSLNTDVAIVTLITAVTLDSVTDELNDMFYDMNQRQAHCSNMHRRHAVRNEHICLYHEEATHLYNSIDALDGANQSCSLGGQTFMQGDEAFHVVWCHKLLAACCTILVPPDCSFNEQVGTLEFHLNTTADNTFY